MSLRPSPRLRVGHKDQTKDGSNPVKSGTPKRNKLRNILRNNGWKVEPSSPPSRPLGGEGDGMTIRDGY